MSKGIISTVAGALELVGGIALEFVPGFQPLASFLIASGAGLLLGGIGTMLQKGALQGLATATRNPIAPWNVVYGETRVGGTVVYLNSFGQDRKFLDMVIVLACHPCQEVSTLYFDQQRVQIGSHNTSFTPLQQKVSITSIKRQSSLVTVQLSADIPLLQVGDSVYIQNVAPDKTFNGKVRVAQILSRVGGITFTYISGGADVTYGAVGRVRTAWVDYGRKVYMETMLGTQTLGTTFDGLINGTPYDGDASDLILPSDVEGDLYYAQNGNPWTANHSLVGHTAVFLRLHYNDQIFANGLPQISFLVKGKKDIADYRTSPPTYGYTDNAALCLADFLAHPVWGLRCNYGTDIPLTQLNAAANICDEAVTLAAALSPPQTEKRYTCNGTFPVTQDRGETIQNLLTAMAGRMTVIGGQYIINPAHWPGVTTSISNADLIKYSAAPIVWRPTTTVTSLFNGVKGTYLSPANNWQSSDFPRYAQDTLHGYTQDDNLIADQNERRWLDIQLPFTTSCSMAQRIAKIELLRRRRQGTGTFTFSLGLYSVVPFDVLSLTKTTFGWAGKTLEVLAVRLRADRQNVDGVDAVTLTVGIDVQESDSSVYSWSIGEELSPGSFVQAVVPDMLTPEPPANLQLTTGAPVLSWTAPTDQFVLTGGHIEGRYRKIETPLGLWISLGNIAPTVTSLFLSDLKAGFNYTVQLRSVNAGGVPSAWVEATAVGPPVMQWAPRQIQAPANDALFPNEYTFDVAQVYEPTSGADWIATAKTTGAQPQNQYIPHCPQMQLNYRNVKVSPTGGSLPGGVTLYLAVGAEDANDLAAPPSQIIPVSIPSGTNTNSISIGDAAADISGTFELNPSDGQIVNIADKLYTFQAVLTNVDGNVLIGATAADTVANLAAAINLDAGAGTTYAAATTANPSCTAAASDNVITLTAITAGTAGNDLTASGIAAWNNLGRFSGGAAFAWPVFNGLAEYVIYASLSYDLICAQVEGALTPTGGGTTYTPLSLTLTSALQRSTYALPVDTVLLVRTRAAILIHGGVQGAAVDAVTTTTILASQCADAALIDDWTGRKLIIIGRNNASAPYVAFDITAFDPATGLFTVTPDPVAAGVEVGDAMVVSTLGVDNSGNPYVVTDLGLSNSQDLDANGNAAPHAGLVVNDPRLQGAVLKVIAGTSRGASAHIVSNTATALTLDSPLPIDATSIWIIYASTWPYTANSDSTDNHNFTLPVQISTVVSNAVGQSIVIVGLAVDSQGNEALDANAPLRMLFIFGAGMSEKVVGYNTSPPVTTYQMLSSEQVVMVDASGGPVTVILPPQSVTRTSPRYVKKIDNTTNAVTVQAYGSETIDGVASVTLSRQGDSVTLLPNVSLT